MHRLCTKEDSNSRRAFGMCSLQQRRETNREQTNLARVKMLYVKALYSIDRNAAQIAAGHSTHDRMALLRAARWHPARLRYSARVKTHLSCFVHFARQCTAVVCLGALSLYRRMFKSSIRGSNSILQLDTDKVCSFTSYARFPFNVPLWDRGHERRRWDVTHVRDEDVERCLQVVVDSHLITTL